MYKALFELSADRAEFVSRLFSRPRPDHLDAASTPSAIFEAYANAAPSEALYEENLKAIEGQLAGVHGFPLSADDRRGIAHVYHAFYAFGPGINYSSSETGNANLGYRPTYTDLMVATDAAGDAHSYLAAEELFAIVKALQARNLIVPVVGDFAGRRPSEPSALISSGTMRRSRPSTCRTSSSICGWSACGGRSAATPRGYRSTRPARSSARAAAAAIRGGPR